MKRREPVERIVFGLGIIGGRPDEIDVDPRGDGSYNVDSYFQEHKLEHRLVLTRAQLDELRAKIDRATSS